MERERERGAPEEPNRENSGSWRPNGIHAISPSILFGQHIAGKALDVAVARAQPFIT